MIVAGPQDVLASRLCQRIGLTPTPHLRCMGVVYGGELRAVVGFDSWNGASCQMHVAAVDGHWVTRELLRQVFWYPFVACKLAVVLGAVPSGNTRALRFNERIGFTEVARIEGAHPDGALVIMQMRRENCRWIKEAHRGQKERTATDHA